MPTLEHIGHASSLSWSRRLRKAMSDLFGNRYVERLERELLQVRLDKDKQIAELTKERDTLLNAMLAVKGIAVRQPIVPQSSTGIPQTIANTTSWQALQAKAIEENAKAEAEDAKKSAAQEN